MGESWPRVEEMGQSGEAASVPSEAETHPGDPHAEQ